jgi:prepilin-type N-terminal cleavage/methylation domain-containing protein
VLAAQKRRGRKLRRFKQGVVAMVMSSKVAGPVGQGLTSPPAGTNEQGLRSTAINPSRARARGGFTLVELLAAMAILALLLGLSVTIVNKARAAGDETACSQQLRDIALTMQTWVDQRNNGKWPKERGIKFLLMPVKEGYITGEGLKKFACPGTNDVTFDPGDPTETIGSGLTDWENLNPDCISYAGRDAAAYGIVRSKLENEPLAADDDWEGQAGRANHGDVVLMVYADGHVVKKELGDYKDVLPEGQDWLPVGPDSPDEDLKKLAFD